MEMSLQRHWIVIPFALGAGILAAYSPLFGGIMAMAIAFLFLVARQPANGLVIVALTFPFLSRNSVLLNTLPLKSFLDLLTLTLLLTWFVHSLVNRNPRVTTPIGVPVAIYGVITVVSALLNGKSPGSALLTAKSLVYFYVALILVVSNILPLLTSTLVMGGVVLGLDGIYQSLTYQSSWVLRFLIKLRIYTPDTVTVLGYDSIVGGARAVSIFPSSTSFAGFLLFVIPVAIGLAFYLHGRRTSVLAWLGVLILTWSLVVTQSRGGFLGLAAGVIVLYTQVGKKHRRAIMWFVSIALVMLGVLVALGFFGRLDSLTTLGYITNIERIRRWKAGLTLLARAPWFGVGPGQYRDAYALFAPGDAPALVLDAHNLYLQTAVETGLLGLVSFLAVFVGGFYVVSRKALANAVSPEQRILVAGLVAAMVAFLTHGLVDYVSSLPEINYQVWLYLGLLAGLTATPGRSRPHNHGASLE